MINLVGKNALRILGYIIYIVLASSAEAQNSPPIPPDQIDFENSVKELKVMAQEVRTAERTNPFKYPRLLADFRERYAVVFGPRKVEDWLCNIQEVRDFAAPSSRSDGLYGKFNPNDLGVFCFSPQIGQGQGYVLLTERTKENADRLSNLPLHGLISYHGNFVVNHDFMFTALVRLLFGN